MGARLFRTDIWRLLAEAESDNIRTMKSPYTLDKLLQAISKEDGALKTYDSISNGLGLRSAIEFNLLLGKALKNIPKSSKSYEELKKEFDTLSLRLSTRKYSDGLWSLNKNEKSDLSSKFTHLAMIQGNIYLLQSLAEAEILLTTYESANMIPFNSSDLIFPFAKSNCEELSISDKDCHLQYFLSRNAYVEQIGANASDLIWDAGYDYDDFYEGDDPDGYLKAKPDFFVSSAKCPDSTTLSKLVYRKLSGLIPPAADRMNDASPAADIKQTSECSPAN